MYAIVVVLALLVALVPARAAGQSCGPEPGAWAGVEAGRVGYDVAGGVSGYEWGGDAGLGSRAVAARLSYRRVQLDDADVTPQLVRASVRFAVPGTGRLRLCLAAHGGGSHFSGPAGDGTVLAGGAGLGLGRPVIIDQVLLVPFIEARGLAAQATGTVLDVSTDATGLSLGVEGGAVAHVGRLHIRATASADGFGAGLGVTPYPAWGFRLGLGYRF